LPERPHPAFAEATLPRDGQVGEGVSPALDAQTEKHNDPRRSTYSLQQRNDIECVAVMQKRIEPGSQQPEAVPQQALPIPGTRQPAAAPKKAQDRIEPGS
jgi:hypothetical protein